MHARFILKYDLFQGIESDIKCDRLFIRDNLTGLEGIF